jgi:hypothetical protein
MRQVRVLHQQHLSPIFSVPPVPLSHPGPRSRPGHPALNPGSIPNLQRDLGKSFNLSETQRYHSLGPANLKVVGEIEWNHPDKNIS